MSKYKLSFVCSNCGKQFSDEFKKGDDVNETLGRCVSREKMVTCPNCGSMKVRKGWENS